jgi:hypothetical protein
LLKTVELELDHEKENEQESTEIPLADFHAQKLSSNMTNFLKSSGFTLQDALGKSVVTLVCETETETKKIAFDVEQIYQQESNNPEFDDMADKEEFKESNENYFTLDIEIVRKDKADAKVALDVDLY